MYVICIIAFADWLSTSISNPVIPFFVKSLGGTEADVGYMYSLTSLVTVILMPSFGRFSDLYGRKPVLLLALAASATAQFCSSFAPSLTWLKKKLTNKFFCHFARCEHKNVVQPYQSRFLVQNQIIFCIE